MAKLDPTDGEETGISTSNSLLRCPECGSSFASGLADGLCPACLFVGLDGPEEISEPASAADPSLPSLLPIPGYTIVAELARGGMGIVYRARQKALDREVALKMLLPFSASSHELRERFRQEARTLTELDHPAILPIYETGEHDGLPWFSMKLATGGSLADSSSKFFGRWREIAELVATIADAVQFAHGHGVLHRDLKPGNILFDTAARPFVADFGLAKLAGRDSDLTQSHRMLGTPHYLAPEVAARSARHATTESDVYSLGAILFELLAGRPPFEAEGLPALLKKIVEDEPDFLSGTAVVNIPTDLKVIVLKCLAKDPAHRYASARDLADELRRYLAGEPILARATGRAEKLWRWSRRKPALASAVAACVFMFVFGMAGVLWQLRQTEAARAEAVKKAKDEETQRALAEAAQKKAERSELVMRQNLYAADMLGAQRALEQNDLGGARLLLDAHRPTNGQADLRGFEWRYFWGKTRGDDFLTLRNNGHEVSTLAFSPNGEFLAFGSRQVLLYNTTNFQLVAKADTPHIQSLTFLPRTHHLLLGSRGLDVWLWDWKKEGPPPVLFKSGRWPNVIASPSTNLAVVAAGFGANLTGQNEGLTALYYAQPYDDSGKLWRLLPESGGTAAFSPDGTLIASGSSQGKIKLWNPANGDLVKTLTNANRITAISFSPDGETLAACSFDDSAWLYDIATGAQRPIARGHSSRVVDARISPDGRTLATGSTDQTVRLWDLETGQQKALFRGHSYIVSRVAWSPNGKILASGGQDGTVRLWNVHQTEATEKPLPGQVERRLLSPDGRMVALFSPNQNVTLYAFPGIEMITGPRPVGLPLKFLPDGHTLVTFRQSTNGLAELLRWSIPELTLLNRTSLIETTNRLLAPTLSPDGRWLAAGLGRGTAGLWDVSGEPILTRLSIPAPQTGLIMAVAFSPNSQRLAATFMDLTVIHTWELASPERVEIGQHPGFISHLIFSHDSSQIISADSDKFIRVWDFKSRNQLATLQGHRQGIIALDLSADGRTLASSSSDRTLRLWNLATYREVGRFEMESEPYRIAFAPDDRGLFFTQRGSKPAGPSTTLWRAPDLNERDYLRPLASTNSVQL